MALAPFATDAGENPYTLHQELQQTMNDLVGIIRREGEMQGGARAGSTTSASAREHLSVEGHRQFNPGWHLALDLRNMLLSAECVALAALERQESRGGHTREDYPGMDPTWRGVNLICRLRRPTGRGVTLTRQPVPAMRRDLLELFDRSSCGKYFTPAELSVLDAPAAADSSPGGPAMTYDARFRVWRGDAGGGALVDFAVEVNEGEVVLDIIHRLQATQAPDLAVRWNCKAGKCGSCSAEVNGRPRLLCMTRMSIFAEDETITVTPMRAFPVVRDLVTDVSFNYDKARRGAGVLAT